MTRFLWFQGRVKLDHLLEGKQLSATLMTEALTRAEIVTHCERVGVHDRIDS